MKWSDIVRGTRQDEPVELPPPVDLPADHPPIKAAVRALNAVEEERVLSAAVKRAKTAGAAKTEPGDPIFDLALMIETIAASFMDPDSPQDERKPIFDGGPDQVREAFGREAITLLYEQQQSYQDRVSPTLKRLGAFEWSLGLDKLADENEREAIRFFERCSAGLRWSFMRTSALLLKTSLTPSSSSGSEAERNGDASRTTHENV